MEKCVDKHYIFVNAFDNPNNKSKQKRTGEGRPIVLAGSYTFKVKFTANASVMKNGIEGASLSVEDDFDRKHC